MRASALKRLLCRPNIADHLELFRVNCLSGNTKLDVYMDCMQKVKEYQQTTAAAPLINGDDLIEMGYSPGPIFNKILQTIEDLQFELVLQTREEALEHIKTAFPLSGKTQP